MILVALLLLSCSTAFTVQCTTPDMNTYSPQVSFVCTFSESVSLNHVERIFVPSLVSVSPLSGEHTVYTVVAEVQDDTLGEISLLLGEGAFGKGEERSPEYMVTVTCSNCVLGLMSR